MEQVMFVPDPKFAALCVENAKKFDATFIVKHNSYYAFLCYISWFIPGPTLALIFYAVNTLEYFRNFINWHHIDTLHYAHTEFVLAESMVTPSNIAHGFFEK